MPIKYGTNVVVFPCRACMLYCLRLKLYKICGNISTPLFISPDTTFCCFIVLLLMQLIEPQKWNRYFNRQTTAPEQFTCYILPPVKVWIHARARAHSHTVCWRTKRIYNTIGAKCMYSTYCVRHSHIQLHVNFSITFVFADFSLLYIPPLKNSATIHANKIHLNVAIIKHSNYDRHRRTNAIRRSHPTQVHTVQVHFW